MEFDVPPRRKLMSHRHSCCFRTISGNLVEVFRGGFELCTGCVIHSFELEQIEVTTAMMELLRENMADIVTLKVGLNNSSGPNGRLEPLIEVTVEIDLSAMEPLLRAYVRCVWIAYEDCVIHCF